MRRRPTLADVSFCCVCVRVLSTLRYGFLSKVFGVFEELEISVDVVATSEVSVSVTLDISKVWARDLKNEELEKLEKSFEGLATVSLHTKRTILSLIGNPERSNEILARTFAVLTEKGINPEMISKGANKNNIAMIVPEELGEECLQALHQTFFQ
uniref:aspartate kinase n=1 Tax=Phaeocystis cordata TaxID=118079 RepID=A0A7S1HQ75_9EUKA|mmetsp:Transcript_15022/g.38087  ORF Transcript_15022/g.38087 Transcript_15022/m.38087 type:complete len:155 (+) Transcript_15022:1519-1983(+)